MFRSFQSGPNCICLDRFCWDQDNQMYPNRFENFVIIVPTEYQEKLEFFNYFLQSPLFNVWLAIILLITICRKIFQHLLNKIINSRTITYIWIDTVGISFGTSSGSKIYNRSENVLIYFLSIFSMIAGIFCSGMLFKQFSINSYTPTILTLKDLNQNNHLTIYVPDVFFDKLDLDKE